MYYKEERLPSTKQCDDLDDILLEVAKDLILMQREFPLTIMYLNLDNMGYAYMYLEEALKKDQYVGEPIPENRLFGMYHQGYTQRMKSHIVSELATGSSRIRFVLATVALGMGLDCPALRKVIHFGSPTTIEKYLQETGRTGRDGQPAVAIIYYNRMDIRSNRPGQSVAMSEFCKATSGCLREILLVHLGYVPAENRLRCQCCQFCKRICKCPRCTVQ